MNPVRKSESALSALACRVDCPAWRHATLAFGLLLALGCGSNRSPRTVSYDRSVDAGASDAAVALPLGPAECLPARTTEPLPARVNVTSAEARVATGGRTVFVRDMFAIFRTHCGQCHVDAKQGDFQVSEATFAAQLTPKVFEVMKSDDPAKYMPPFGIGKKFSERTPGDPVLELIKLLETWDKNGKSPNPFTVASNESEPDAANRYVVPPEIGAAFTNLGNCIPNKAMVGSATAKMDELDTFFAAAKELPERLEQTDFIALDSETLARHGVVSFAPGYPLWSDAAGKMRHIRVPRGKSVTFDKATQVFTVPDNTRFYKTFLKKVIDREGNESYRKIETRLIVTRHDRNGANGAVEIQALFGAYVWNDEETEAILLREPLRDGTPFTDLMLTYVTDEPKVQAIKDKKPLNLIYELEERNPGLLRRYAVPGSGRCRECHMGSPDASFSLGFTPLQIRRRPNGEGGTLEPFPGEDELTQLDRLIDYGLVTGLTPADVAPLEKSQGTREARNEHELTAQGYMLGNCAGCHNPRGFPTFKNPELRDLLNFLPTASDGGIFQFPLERVSPRIKRGRDLDQPIPYITPSLRDLPMDEGTDLNVYKPKWFPCTTDAECGTPNRVEFVDAPWRSLIYRNVDAPFSYSDDYAIFPHMPRNTPGFDCRAPRIMADWMVSIPARRKMPMLDEDSFPGTSSPSLSAPDFSVQPYIDVPKDDPKYGAAVTDAKFRHAQYRKGKRYSFCPDATDIVDARVKGNVLSPPDLPIPNSKSGKLIAYADNVPDRAHWVPTDLSDAPVAWLPRRSDWEKVLVPRELADKTLTVEERKPGNKYLYADYFAVLEALNDVRVTEGLRKLALDPVPYGLWKQKPECADKLKTQKKVSDFVGPARPPWMDKAKAAPDAPVYVSGAGAAVFNMICVSCHGSKADSRGIQAETLADLTGGVTRVANLRDGLFGHGTDGTRNLDRIFGKLAGLYPKGAAKPRLVTAEDWAARYVAWMGMGGTLAQILPAILNNVGISRIMEVPRRPLTANASANMLQAAQLLCRGAIPHSGVAQFNVDLDSFLDGDFAWSIQSPLVDQNGDADMWRRLCFLNNRQIVRVLRRATNWNPTDRSIALKPEESYYWADGPKKDENGNYEPGGYPPNAPVMDQNGEIQLGVHPDNTFAVCAETPDDPEQAALLTKFLAENPARKTGKVMPTCPPKLFELDPETALPAWKLVGPEEANGFRFLDINAWAARGAINAGVAVMLYLDQLQRDQRPTPRFDQCQEL